MKTYCFWECRLYGALFLVDSVDVVKVCPFHPDVPPHVDEETNEPYPDHFEDGHLRRIFSERLLK